MFALIFSPILGHPQLIRQTFCTNVGIETWETFCSYYIQFL